MHIELKKAIFNYMMENTTEFQLVNNTRHEFKQYIFDPKGDYCIGGEEVDKFILAVAKL